MIEAPAILLFSWLLGIGRDTHPAGGLPKKPAGDGGAKGGAPDVQQLPDIGAWPRAVPEGGEIAMKLTGGNDPVAWRKSRLQAARIFLSTDDRSINAMTKLVEDGAVEHSDFAIDEIALSVVTHWDIETAKGSAEFNFNVGGVLAVPGQQYFRSKDVQSGKDVAFCAYDDLTEGIADYFGVLSYQRYASALTALLMLPTDPGWFSELGWAGYYGMDPVAAEKLWSDRRAEVAADTKGA